MPVPKLSALLNNCGLHALTPEIKAEIALLAKEPKRTHNFKINYLDLKDDFADFYGIARSSFSMQQFSLLLEQYNDLDTQIIMGPVLRRFMGRGIAEREGEIFDFVEVSDAELEQANGNRVQAFIKKMTEMRNGRYENLSTEDISKYAGRPLGISISLPNSNQEPYLVEHAIASINLYHTGMMEEGHWERTLQEKERTQTKSQFKSFIELLGQDAIFADFGIHFLKKHVRFTLHSIVTNASQKSEFSTLDASARKITSYLTQVLSEKGRGELTHLYEQLEKEETEEVRKLQDEQTKLAKHKAQEEQQKLKLEKERKVQEEQRKREEERKAQEEQRKLEEERKAQEEQRKLEEERKDQEEQRKLEKERKDQEEQQKPEAESKAQEAQQKTNPPEPNKGDLNPNKEFEDLKNGLKATIKDYIAYNKEHCFFSIIHRHGETGRKNAEILDKEIGKTKTMGELQKAIIQHLGTAQGNTHPHSLKTYLLKAALPQNPQTTLNETSKHFDEKFNVLKKSWGVEVSSLSQVSKK